MRFQFPVIDYYYTLWASHLNPFKIKTKDLNFSTKDVFCVIMMIIEKEIFSYNDFIDFFIAIFIHFCLWAETKPLIFGWAKITRIFFFQKGVSMKTFLHDNDSLFIFIPTRKNFSIRTLYRQID